MPKIVEKTRLSESTIAYRVEFDYAELDKIIREQQQERDAARPGTSDSNKAA